MKTFNTAKEYAGWRSQVDASIGHVASLGALHEGHASLIDHAREADDFVVVSLFVNPTQFGPNEDFTKYPRTREHDLALCLKYGVDVVITPDVNDMYPSGFATRVSLESLVSSRFEGAIRPNHFEGVLVVVLKLFNIIKPTRSYFGQKDVQQLLLVQRMVRDLNLGIEVIGLDTVRSSDGLALSSRNRYMSARERAAASSLYAALRSIKDSLLRGETSARNSLESATILVKRDFDNIDYIDVVDINTFESVTNLQSGNLAVAAARFDSVRLLDNLIL